MAIDQSKLVLSDPDEMSTGLLNDVDVVIGKVRYAPIKYGSMDHHMLGAVVTFKDGEGNDFVQQYSCNAELNEFMPSKDGVNPVPLDGNGEELEGEYLVRVGNRLKLGQGSNWGKFTISLKDAGFPKDKWAASIACLEGAKIHVKRLSFKMGEGRDGKKPTKDSYEVLLVTDFYGYESGGGKTVGASSTVGKANGAVAASSSVDDDLTAALIEALSNSGGQLSKADAVKATLAAFKGRKDARQAVQRAGDEGFLAAGPWGYENNTLSL